MRPLPSGPPRRIGSPPAGDTAPRHDDLENVLAFRRGGGEMRRLRRSPLRKWLGPFLLALLIVAIPSGLVAWTMTSPRFALQDMTVVVTGERVSEEWVRDALSPLMGQNLPLLSLARAESLLRQHPWVRGAALHKQLPDRLTVRVREKRAVALLRHAADLYYLDERGSVIVPFDPHAGGADLVLVSRSQPAAEIPNARSEPGARTGDLRSALELAEEIAVVEPRWRAELSEIVILGEQDFRIYTTSLPFPLLVRAGTLERKVRRLEKLLPAILERYAHAAAVDLRFARRIIVQPSVRAGSDPLRSGPQAAYREATPNHVQRG